MKCYYAHCINLYNTPTEARDMALLQSLGFDVLNPNRPECDAGYFAYGMEFFREFTKDCDLIVFRALPDGGIPAGVAKEIEMFKERSLPAIELPSAITRRTLTVEATKEYLRECGQR